MYIKDLQEDDFEIALKVNNLTFLIMFLLVSDYRHEKLWKAAT